MNIHGHGCNSLPRQMYVLCQVLNFLQASLRNFHQLGMFVELGSGTASGTIMLDLYKPLRLGES